MIEVDKVSKEFTKVIREPGLKGMVKTLFSAKKEKIKAVDDISFKINDGEIVGYIGANGAGKSTTIKMMTGILTPSSGKILINGVEPYSYKNRNKVLKDIGVVFGQRTQLWWDLPLIESFLLYKEIYQVSDEDYKERLAYLSKLLDLDKIMNSQVRTLSLGQRMRADLGAALIYNPKILFLDEPTIGLDVLVKEKITTAIKEINAKYKTTIILTTHDMSDIKKLCSRVIIIDEGHILYDGSIEKIKDRFGDIRHIFFLTDSVLDKEKMNEKFNNLLSFDKDEQGYMEVTYDADKIPSKDVLTYLLSNLNIQDLKISENSLTKVVKKIYETKSI